MIFVINLTDLGLEVEKIIDPKKNLSDFFVVKIFKKMLTQMLIN